MHYRDKNGIEEMKKFLGIKKIEELYTSYICEDKLDDKIGFDGKNEFEVLKEMEELSLKNKQFKSFLGAGVYDHYIPSVVDYLSSRSEFLTSYTPYQAEASQGTLQYIFEYQTLIAELLNMDIVNASHYDGAVSAVEAIRLAYHYFEKKKNKIVLSSKINPEYIKVMKTYLSQLDLKLCFIDETSEEENILNIVDLVDENTVCVFIQNPNFFGEIKDLNGIADKIHQKKSLLILHTDLLYAVSFKTPGDLDCDIATSEGQVLGIPMSFGGPYLGVISIKEKFLRKLPGRLVGETLDKNGNRGFVLTLATREQHIRREKSLSNICTNQSLMALKAVIYLSYMGAETLKEISMDCFDKINYLKEEIAKIKGFTVKLKTLNFNDLLVKTEFNLKSLFQYFKEKGIILGLPLSVYHKNRTDEFLLSVTEKKSIEEINDLIFKLKEYRE